MLVEIPDDAYADQAVEQVQSIMRTAMERVTPGIPIRTSAVLADHWKH